MIDGLNTTWLLFGLILLAANLPWFSNKFLYLIPLKQPSKKISWCLLELIVLYFLAGAVSSYAEFATFGQLSHQNWEFYAVTGCLFLVFAFPGFVFKALWK